MKIIIENNDFSNTRGVFIFCNGKRLQNKIGGMHPNDFSEDDILELLGYKKFKQYENGKFEFAVTQKELFALTEDYKFYKP